MPFRHSVSTGLLLALSVIAPSGCMTGGAAPSEESGLYGDRVDGVPQCGPQASSPTDMACHEDCTRDCGFTHPLYPRAQKYCVCQAGVFIECRCPRPDWYQGAPDAPYCDAASSDGSGRVVFVDKHPCKAEWDQCIARDPVDGYTPKGCVCTQEMDGTLVWECGSTEKWFYIEQSTSE